MDVSGKRAVVVGLGRSGVASARLLVAKGAKVVAADTTPREKFSKAALDLEAHLHVELAPGSNGDDAIASADLVVVSPGVPSFAALESAERRGVEVIGELELASRFFTTPIALIGGTNGKSTTTALTAAILEAAGKKVFIGGNYGTPLAEVVGQSFDVLVLEISSFQAERVPTLHAHAHALLNITDDHLDRYASFEAYANAKGNPFVNMTSNDLAVIPYGDELCAKQAGRGAAEVLTFSGTDTRATVKPFKAQIVHSTGWLSVPLSALQLSGTHNVANACAAFTLAYKFHLPGDPQEASDTVERALRNFKGLDHRTVLVAEIDGVRWYDDSKGTNVGASVTALRGLREPKAVLIAGGRDKQGSYEPLVDALRDKGRALVVIGEAADKIAAAAAGVVRIERAASMEQAVEIARELAQTGDAVLLSPACSSFDMFRDYKHRGDAFAAAVRALLEPKEGAL